ncbi:DNA repair metallo-beta-lactamase-domain-containing protein [Glomus cerebriforme]|uniref:DNA repair metallo-beta-lactamase-domain-containing protein n=1 Tax=Glomus cerebriforme TaxID=658196 RepID=A0A397T4N7_9GLOM|nr:DNA repair metallo-beta-lactamase-domain-containing protein [Glomus cerebriforme]
MSEDSLWEKRTNELVQKIRVSGNIEKKTSIKRSIITTTENVKQKDAFFSSQSKNERSQNSFKATRAKQNNDKTARTISTTKTQTLLSFFAPKATSNRTTENNDKGIDINIERNKNLTDNAFKRVKYETGSMIKVDNEINVKKDSTQIPSKYWSSELFPCEENDQKLNLTIDEMAIIDDVDNSNFCPICGISLINLPSKKSNEHVNNCLDSPLTNVEKIFDNTSSLPLEPFLNNAEISKQNTLFSIDKKDSTNILDVEQSENDGELVIVEKQERFETKPKSRKECPWYKKLPGTSITVDAFKYGKIPHCTAYFLSHFHSDHYGGLTSKWSHGLIYCSTVTGNLVIQQLKVARHFIRKLPMNEEVSIDNNNGTTVTLIDANHCPGSALFLFKLRDESGQIKRYLHTGDFRACPQQVLHSAIAQPQNPVIDILYLDTTYLNPQYCFPAQEQVVNAVIKLIYKAVKRGELVPMKRNNGNNGQWKNRHLQLDKSQLALDKWFKKTPTDSFKPEQSENVTKPVDIADSYEVDLQNDEYEEDIDIDEKLKNSKILIIIGTYLIGKEKIFLGIAKAFRSKIYVTDEKRKMLMCQEITGIESLLTNNPHQACVHVVSLMSIKLDSLCAYLENLKPTFKYVMAFRPTGWTYKGQKFSTSSTTKEILNTPTQFTIDTITPTFSTPLCQIFGVPYSEHSSFRELAAFVMSLNVKQIIPTVNIGSEKSRENMNYWLGNWQKEKSKNKNIEIVPYNTVDHW